MAPGNKSSMAAPNIIETPQVPNSPVPDQAADALVLLSGVDHLISNDDTTMDVASSSMVDALMTLTSENPKNDGKNSTSTSGAATNSSADVPVNAITKNEPMVAAGGSGTSSSGNDGQGGSGSGHGSGSKGPAVKPKCIGKLNRSTRWTTVLDQGGWRNYMEDKIMTMHNFMSMPCNQFGGCTSPDCAAATSRIHYLGLFDGHGGSQVSEYCASTLHKLIEEEWTSETGVDDWILKWHIALSRAYERADEECKKDPLASAGSTAVVVLVSACQIIAANCGDSRAVLVRKRETIPLTSDHKPDRIDEMQRIGKADGCILNIRGVLRVAGILTMTRAIGDQSLKPWVSSNPEITFTTRSKEDECLIIASDGVWDVMTTDEVGEFALDFIREKRRAALSGDGSSLSVANLILKEARLRRSTDNISVIAVDLKPLRKRRPMQP